MKFINNGIIKDDIIHPKIYQNYLLINFYHNHYNFMGLNMFLVL